MRRAERGDCAGSLRRALGRARRRSSSGPARSLAQTPSRSRRPPTRPSAGSICKPSFRAGRSPRAGTSTCRPKPSGSWSPSRSASWLYAFRDLIPILRAGSGRIAEAEDNRAGRDHPRRPGGGHRGGRRAGRARALRRGHASAAAARPGAYSPAPRPAVLRFADQPRDPLQHQSPRSGARLAARRGQPGGAAPISASGRPGSPTTRPAARASMRWARPSTGARRHERGTDLLAAPAARLDRGRGGGLRHIALLHGRRRAGRPRQRRSQHLLALRHRARRHRRRADSSSAFRW